MTSFRRGGASLPQRELGEGPGGHEALARRREPRSPWLQRPLPAACRVIWVVSR